MSDRVLARLPKGKRLPLLLFLAYDKAAPSLSPALREHFEEVLVEALSESWSGTQKSDDAAECSLLVGSSGDGPELVLTSTLPNEDLSDEDGSSDVSDWVLAED